MRPTDFSIHLTGFLGKYLPGQIGMSTNSIKSYRDAFKLLLNYCNAVLGIPPEKLTLKHFNCKMVEEFLLWLENERKCSISTRNQRLASIHSFFKYLQAQAPENILLCHEILSIHTKKYPKPVINYLTLEGMKAIFSQPNPASESGRRDLVLLSLLYDTGARVQEIADVVAADVRLSMPSTIKLTGKGQKSRIVPLTLQTANLLKGYIAEQGLNASEKKSRPLFSNKSKQKLTRSGISYILDKYVLMARGSNPEHIPDVVTPHSLRHSKAMHLLQSGVNLIYIRDLLGHVDIKVTEVYARADAEMKRKALTEISDSITPYELPPWQANTELASWLKNLCNDE
jgi:site-specific recombinase XerD